MSCQVVEELKSRQIRFLQVDVTKLTQERQQIKFVQLGILVNNTNLAISPLVKYRSVTKTDEETGKKYNVSIVVRENGRFEVYSDFMLVDEYYDVHRQCVDVETDFHQFMLKFVTNSDMVSQSTELEDLEFEIRRVRHFWRNRISFSTSKTLKDVEKWDSVVQKRIANYSRLYTSVINFSMYMLVSHRNMISFYDMSKSNGSVYDPQGNKDFEHGRWV